jgi:drug/metabolite transporter (DMT)-like permease
MDRTPLADVALTCLGVSLIPLGDAAGKLLTQGHGVSPGFVAFSRFAVGAALAAAILYGRVDPALYRRPAVWLRAALIAGGIACIQTALRTEPVADVFGAFFVGPLVSYALSVLWLREAVTPARTALTVLGFCGVLMVLRPGWGMSPGLLWALAAGMQYGAFLMLSLLLAPVAAPGQLMLSQTALGTVLLAPVGLWALPEPTAPVLGLVLLSGAASAAGNLLLILAYARAPATRLAPFVYFQLFAAIALGWAVFGDWPAPAVLMGLVLIAAAGLGTLALRVPLTARPARATRGGGGP